MLSYFPFFLFKKAIRIIGTFFEKVLTKAQYKRNFDRDTIIQILMLCELSNEYDFGSFRSNDMNKFIIYYNEIISKKETRKKTLTKVDIISKALDKLDEEFTEPIKIKNNSLALCVYGLYYNIKNSKSITNYMTWLHNFIETYDTNEAYLAYCSSGTASAENVKGRLQYFRDAIKTM